MTLNLSVCLSLSFFLPLSVPLPFPHPPSLSPSLRLSSFLPAQSKGLLEGIWDHLSPGSLSSQPFIGFVFHSGFLLSWSLLDFVFANRYTMFSLLVSGLSLLDHHPCLYSSITIGITAVLWPHSNFQVINSTIFSFSIVLPISCFSYNPLWNLRSVIIITTAQTFLTAICPLSLCLPIWQNPSPC